MKHSVKTIIALLLTLACIVQPCSALAASSKKTYVKEFMLSYGNTADEAKKWLKDNGYEVLDYDLNEGADDTFSKKRAVYLGYKTTTDAADAVTDMRLMNMKGGYSVQDYQIMLDEQKANIELFIGDFVVAVNEYRANYAKGQERAKAAHDMLNYLYDDDTQAQMGDLLLNKIKEEYTEEEYNALDGDVKAKTADMTTILMQGNADAVLAIEQTIATASDSSDTLWTERYAEASTYDEMLDELMEAENMTVNEAEKFLAAEYDEDARAIASKIDGYIEYLENYTKEDITLLSSAEEIKAYEAEHTDFSYTDWFTAGTQYELLKVLMNDDVSLLELMTGEDFDVLGDDRCMLYPLVASLTKGQRACLDFMTLYGIVALGINGDEATAETMTDFKLKPTDEKGVSVYDGVDRTLFGGEVALTNDAIRLRASTGKEAVRSRESYISATSYVLYGVFCLSAICAVAAWKHSASLAAFAAEVKKNVAQIESEAAEAYAMYERLGTEQEWAPYKTKYDDLMSKSETARTDLGKTNTMTKYFRYAGIALTCISIIIMGISLWNTYNDLKEYYKSDFTPIPMHMVDEGVDENDEKVYTYYTAVACNRKDAGMVTSETEILEDYGDLNGDVGRQWVALYTTKDKAAGYPVQTNMLVRYEDSKLPDEDSTALSMFGEKSAQNLTNETAGYTYNDGKSGIYMFFSVDTAAFAGSVFSGSRYVLMGGAAAVLLAAAFAAGMYTEKKGKKKTKNNVQEV